jgi:NADPH:quinone reductase-like Zn-dependent oxidoreductase
MHLELILQMSWQEKALYRASPALPAVLGYEVVGIVEKTKDP